jgi:hypothetical protein
MVGFVPRGKPAAAAMDGCRTSATRPLEADVWHASAALSSEGFLQLRWQSFGGPACVGREQATVCR